MSFILDTDICSAYVRGDRRVLSRFEQYWGSLHVSSITVGELGVWANRTATESRIAIGIGKLLTEITAIPFGTDEANAYGRTRAALLDRGIVVPATDLLIAVTAQLRNFTLVTHNRKHFGLVPGLRIQDWTE